MTGPDPTAQTKPTTVTVRDPGPGEHQPRHAAAPPVPASAEPTGGRRLARALGRGVARTAIAGLQSLWRVAAWRRGPVGGFVAPLLVLVVLLGAAGVAGATLPQRHPGPPVAATSSQPVPTPATSTVTPQTGGDDLPSEAPSTDPVRPVDGLDAWAQRLSPVVGVPATALKAYGNAQLTAAVTLPACHLSWTTLAGFGKVESDHGATGGATLLATGKVNPPIIGPALDGSGGRALVRDTDLGRLDGDTTYDRAIGPMQFLPSTWQTYQADGDGDGITDPGDLNDAALAAADYLCDHNRNLTQPTDWWAAVLSYNAVQTYAQNVYAAADNYGRLSRTVPAG